MERDLEVKVEVEDSSLWIRSITILKLNVEDRWVFAYYDLIKLEDLSCWEIESGSKLLWESEIDWKGKIDSRLGWESEEVTSFKKGEESLSDNFFTLFLSKDDLSRDRFKGDFEAVWRFGGDPEEENCSI